MVGTPVRAVAPLVRNDGTARVARRRSARIANQENSQNVKTYEAHPLADIVPAMSAAEYRELAVDVKAHGLREPIALFEGKVLDGRHRLRACADAGIKPRYRDFDGDEAAAIAFVLSENLHRRHLDSGQRACVIVDAEEAYARIVEKGKAAQVEAGRAHGGDRRSEAARKRLVEKVPQADPDSGPAPKSRDLAAATAGTNPKYVDAAVTLKKEDPAAFERVKTGKTKMGRAIKDHNRAKKAKAQAAAIVEVAADSGACSIRSCTMQALLADPAFASTLDAIITDPPYPKEFLDLYEDLARLAKSALKPHGILAVMVGQSYLPEILARMTRHMEYAWTLAYLTPGGQAVQIWNRKVNTFWKPVLLFGGPQKAGWIGDVVSSDVNDNDKAHHHWGQSESGMARLVERLTKPGDLVCDPFLGGGTTAVVSLALGRKFVGCDTDNASVAEARKRVGAKP